MRVVVLNEVTKAIIDPMQQRLAAWIVSRNRHSFFLVKGDSVLVLTRKNNIVLNFAGLKIAELGWDSFPQDLELGKKSLFVHVVDLFEKVFEIWRNS